MIQIIPAAHGKKSFSEKLNAGIGRGLEIGSQLMQQHEKKQAESLQQQQRNAKLKELTGLDLSDIPEPVQQKFVESFLQRQGQKEKYGFESEMAAEEAIRKAQLEGQKLSGQKREKIAPFQAGIQTINEMRNLRQKGNLGIGASYSPFSATRQDAAQYEQLGKSLISLASTIPIRNQQEFKTLAENLYDPNITDATAKGILDAMENIIKRNMQSFEEEENIEMPSKTEKPKEKPPLSSFHR